MTKKILEMFIIIFMEENFKDLEYLNIIIISFLIFIEEDFKDLEYLNIKGYYNNTYIELYIFIRRNN